MRLRKTLICLAALSLLASTLPTASARQASGVQDWNQPFKPFRIIGNINYVGTNNLACFLIATSAGNILIDTGLQESAPIIRANISTLGFKLTDIKIILSSHAHFDHVAGHADMKTETGAQVFAMDGDAQIMESGGKKGFHPLTPYKPVKIDRVLKDGEVVKLGNVALTAHLTPGHTEGNTTWTTTVEENGKKYDVVFAGSMSINPGVHMVNFPAWPNIAEVYAKSFKVLKSLPCDVFLGPHAPFFHMEEKVLRRSPESQTNPFIDPAGFSDYIASFEKAYASQIEREKKGK